ncbi:unnamed protein product [Vicia faba]|uniref:Transposase-associated domain-containing protein n=1 Tax=Vicia faba TaxID=3906 RepID=A0AAV0ZIL2_VICFA|nr:unnamed protein product [Vicia faba]
MLFSFSFRFRRKLSFQHLTIVSGCKESLLKIASGCNRFSKSFQIHKDKESRNILNLVFSNLRSCFVLTDRSWICDRVNSNRYGLKDEFVSGVEDFVNKAMNRPDFLNDGGIRCPCEKCVCIPLKTPSEVRHHLYKNVFLPNYYTWTDHGEDTQNVDFDGHSSSGRNYGGDNQGDEEQLDAMNEMVYDARRQFVNVPDGNVNMENETVSEGEQSLVVLYNIVGRIHFKD